MAVTSLSCVTCEQILTNGRCTNGLCPGYVALEGECEDCEAAQERIATLEAELQEMEGRATELQLRGNQWMGRANSLAADNVALKRNVLRKHKALEIASGVLAEHDGYEWARAKVDDAIAPEKEAK